MAVRIRTIHTLTFATAVAAGLNIPAGMANAAFISSPTLSTFAVYAERSVKLGQNVTIKGGDVGVLGAAPASFGPQLTVDAYVNVDTLHNLLSPTVDIGPQATLGSVQTYNVTNNGGTMGPIGAFPFSAMPLMPLRPPRRPSGQDITVRQGQTRSLSPGEYGVLIVDGVVTLAPGLYFFSAVTVGNSGSLYSTLNVACGVSAGASCSTRILISGALGVRQHGTVEPRFGPPNPGSLAPVAASLSIMVQANDIPGTLAANIGRDSRIHALISVPAGTLSFAEDIVARGAFSGFDVVAGARTTLVFESGLPTSAPGECKGCRAITAPRRTREWPRWWALLLCLPLLRWTLDFPQERATG